MKKPHYPAWVTSSILFICLIYITCIVFSFTMYWSSSPYEFFLTNSLSGVFLSLTICLMSALFILREKEALYIVVLLSFMILFFNTMVWIGTWVMWNEMLSVYIVLLLIHFAVLCNLSYQCFGALSWGWNYNDKKEKKHKKK